MKNKVFIIILFIVLFGLSFILKNYYNIFMEEILLIKDNNIVFEDNFTKNYIKNLEQDIASYKDITKLECKSASIIYRDPIFWYDSFTINKGKNDNVNINQLVINDKGVLGIISKVYKNSSEVLMLTSINNSKITVSFIDDPIVYGLISGYDRFNNLLVVSELTSNVNDNVDVVTTSFTNKFKDGLLIGHVKRVEKDENGISLNAYVELVNNFNDIKYVCII